MVGVVVGDDDTPDRPAAQRAGQKRLPQPFRPVPRQAGVDHRPAVTVVERIDVHMVERPGQRQPRPKDAGRHLDHLPGFGRHCEGELHGAGGHAQKSPSDSA